MATLESGICSCSHISVKHIILDCLYSLCVLTSASSSSTLFASDLTFPVITAGTKGLNFLFSILRFTPALQPRRLLFSSSGMVGLSPANIVVLLVCCSQASHFYGTVMTYYPNDTSSDGSVTVIIRYKITLHSCDSISLTCLSGNCGNESVVVVKTVNMENSEPWCQMEGISTRQLSSNAPFQLGLNGGNWINNIKNGIQSWRAVTVVELRNRSDTRQANRSPQTTILPLLRVPSNCPRDFNLLAFDSDGDVVRCRYGNTTLSECNPCTPPSVLTLLSSCTLSFKNTSSSNEGVYAVQLVMEDYPRQTINLAETKGTLTTLTTNDIISQIPVQFVLRVDPAVSSCEEGIFLPRFLPPTPANRAQLYATVNQWLNISISAEANNSTITELLFSGPYNVIQNTSGTGQFTLRWMPSENEAGRSFPICFVIQAVSNLTKYHSGLRCIIVTVGNFVVLKVKISSSVPLTENNFSDIGAQLKARLERLGLPSNITIAPLRSATVKQ
ncbi:uncharacterized protein LOC125015763 isoform X2 [Mugil cephalus]|uniref:uncharacterized protein LOC125015763 isoform X2 n=1 Tax=Mugil cephalus TaxID=48193 RepID=UPI001FB69754|nr:uncharacterized protein LOC125015763 isoform X2 [Mugil cephalus]